MTNIVDKYVCSAKIIYFDEYVNLHRVGKKSIFLKRVKMAKIKLSSKEVR